MHGEPIRDFPIALLYGRVLQYRFRFWKGVSAVGSSWEPRRMRNNTFELRILRVGGVRRYP